VVALSRPTSGSCAPPFPAVDNGVYRCDAFHSWARSPTVLGYSSRTIGFLNGSANGTIALDSSLCTTLTNSWQVSARKAGLPQSCRPMQALRSFFGYAEIRGWCVPGIPLGIRSPRIPNMKIGPRANLGRSPNTHESASGASPNELRAKAILCY